MRILYQSASVFGTLRSVPCGVSTIAIESKMLSAIGSIMSRINSFTETTGFMSPQRAGAAAAGGAGWDEEQHSVRQAQSSSPPRRARLRPTKVCNISTPAIGTLGVAAAVGVSGSYTGTRRV